MGEAISTSECERGAKILEQNMGTKRSWQKSRMDKQLYVSRQKGGRGLCNNEDSVDASTQWLENYIQMRGGRLIAATRNNTNDTRTSETTITRKQKWEEKQLYERFKRLISNITYEKTEIWLRKGNLKRKIASLLIAAQNNAIKANHIRLENR